MTDDSGEQTTPKTRQFMSSTVSTQPTIPEEPSDVSAIAKLVVSTPLVDPEKASIPVPPPDASHRSRRRSSFSVLQSLLNINHSIPNKDIRKRYERGIRDFKDAGDFILVQKSVGWFWTANLGKLCQ